MSAAPKITQPVLPEASLRLLEALQDGAVLTWSPSAGYIVTMPNGKRRRCRWFVASALRKAGYIVCDRQGWNHMKTWRLA